VGQPVLRPVQLGLERAEHPVPDDQDPRVVAVQVDRVRAVVHPVVGRRVEDELDRPRQLADRLGVHEELEDEVDPVGEVDRPRRDAQQRQRQPEEEVEPRVPLLPQRGREVHVLRGMMRLVRRPAHPGAVHEPVLPVVGEVHPGDDQRPRPPGAHRQVPRRDVGVQGDVDDEAAGLQRQRRGERAQAHQDRGAGVPGQVAGHSVVMVEPLQRGQLDPDGGQEERDGPGHRVRPRVEHVVHGSTSRAALC
jgi:hypothetical protein